MACYGPIIRPWRRCSRVWSRNADVEIVMHLETRGRDHVAELTSLLEGKGLNVEEDR
jgi:hypothetical protein